MAVRTFPHHYSAGTRGALERRGVRNTNGPDGRGTSYPGNETSHRSGATLRFFFEGSGPVGVSIAKRCSGPRGWGVPNNIPFAQSSKRETENRLN